MKDVESQLALQLSKEWRQSWAGGRPDFHGNENSKFFKRRDEDRTQSCREKRQCPAHQKPDCTSPVWSLARAEGQDNYT